MFGANEPTDLASSGDGPYLYHLCPEPMYGEVLYPLNGLRDRYPAAYARERVKWAGRESVLDFKVPHLDPAWGDTVNLSTLDPRLLLAARRERGIPVSRLLSRRLARIPVDRVAAHPAVIYDSTTIWINSAPGEDVPATPPESDFRPFRAELYSESRQVPRRHLQYLQAQWSRHLTGFRSASDGNLPGGRGGSSPLTPLAFVFVTHVLVGGPVDLRGIDLLSMDDAPASPTSAHLGPADDRATST